MRKLQVSIDNLDLDYFIGQSEAKTFEELREYIHDEGGFDVEIIYYASAMEYLMNNDPSLRESLSIASEYGYEVINLNSEALASLLASRNVQEDFDKNEQEITEYLDLLQKGEED